MNTTDFFKWNSKASKWTLILPGIAIVVTVLMFYLHFDPYSGLAEEVSNYASYLVLSVVSCFTYVILILLMFFFQPVANSGPRAARKAAEEKRGVVVSSEEEEMQPHPEMKVGKEDVEDVKVETASSTSASGEEDVGGSQQKASEGGTEPEPQETGKFKVIGEQPEPDTPAIEQTPAMPDIDLPELTTYPEDVSGGIFADTYITLKDGSTLKLRQEVVEEIYLIG